MGKCDITCKNCGKPIYFLRGKYRHHDDMPRCSYKYGHPMKDVHGDCLLEEPKNGQFENFWNANKTVCAR